MDKCPLWMMLIALILMLVLSAILVPSLKAEGPQNADILTQILGGTRDLVAEGAYQEADIYLHAGYNCECPDEKHDHHHIEKPAQAETHADLPLMNLVRYLHGEMSPRIHRHLEGKEEKELLPWFVIAVRMNPHYIEAWRTGTYWYYRTGDSRRAEELINDGIKQNPSDYSLRLERGILYHRLKKWNSAVEDLEVAQKLWKNNSEDAPYDLKAIRTFLKDSRERMKSELSDAK